MSQRLRSHLDIGCDQLVSIGTSLRRLKMVDFIYVPIGLSHSRTSCNVMMRSQHGPRRIDQCKT